MSNKYNSADLAQFSSKLHVQQKQYQLNSSYFCSECNILLVNAYQTQCGCFFCNECANKLFSIENPQPCPVGADDCTAEPLLISITVSIDRAKEREVKNKPITCPYTGCTYHGTIGKLLNEHLHLCEHRLIDCPNNCGWQTTSPGNLQNIHFNLTSNYVDICPVFSAKCPWCSSSSGELGNNTLYNRDSIAEHRKKQHIEFTKPPQLNNFIEAQLNDCQENMEVVSSQIQNHPLRDCSLDDVQLKMADLMDHIDVYLPSNNSSGYSSMTSASIDAPSVAAATVSSSGDNSGIMTRICDRQFYWLITNYDERLKQAKLATATTTSVTSTQAYIDSDPIYLSCDEPAYLFRFRLYLNGNGANNQGKFMSVFYQILHGEWDDLLKWPCLMPVEIELKYPHQDSQPPPSSKVYAKLSPTQNTPVAQQPRDQQLLTGTEPCGSPQFVKLETIKEKFVKDDTICLHIKVAM